MDFSKTPNYSQKTPSNLNFVPQPLLNPLTSDQIEKCLDDNKRLILAILECISLGKFIESAQYQEMLQHNLTYLADMANAHSLQGSSQLQAMTSSVHQGNQIIHQTQAAYTPKMQQESDDDVPKLPLMLNTPPLSQDQPLHQFIHIQQFQTHQLGYRSTPNIGMHQIVMRPELSNSSGMDIQESMQVGSSNNGLGKRKRGGDGGKNN